MAEQINLRLPDALLRDARKEAKKRGFGTVQAYIEQAVREDLYDDFKLTPKENELIGRLMKAKNDPRIWLTEEQFQRRADEIREKKRKENANIRK